MDERRPAHQPTATTSARPASPGARVAGAALLAILLGAAAAVGAQPVAGALERLTLTEALARARARNPDALVAAAEVRRAEALLDQTRSGSLPTLLPQAVYSRIDGNRIFMGLNIQSAHQLTASGGITVPLVVPRQWAEWAHASEDRKVATASLAETQRRLAIAVAHAYLAVIVQRRVIAADVNARDAAQAHAAFAQKQLEAGAVSRLDAVRAGQQWHTAEADLSDAQVGLTRAQEALGVLLGGELPVDTTETPNFPLPATRGESARPVEQLRVDIRAQALRETTARHRVRDSWTEYMPYLIGTFDPLYTDPPTIFQPRYSWQAQLQLVLPLFEGGLRYGQLRERRALASEASVTLEGIVRQARADVRLGFDAAERARVRVNQAIVAAKLAHDALDIANLRYREGATTNIDVIDAERQARDTDLAAAVAEDNERQVRLDLLAASGLFP